MFNRILIANRGEIAVRIMRACQELGIQTVAVYSIADKDSRHVKMANSAICIGGNASAESYLNIPQLSAPRKSPMSKRFIRATVSLPKIHTLPKSAIPAR